MKMRLRPFLLIFGIVCVVFALTVVLVRFQRKTVFLHESSQYQLPEGAKFRIGKGRVTDMAYSLDSTVLAVATPIGIWLYDAWTGAELALFTDYMSETGLVAFSPDGKILVNGMYDTLLIWDVTTGKLLKSIKRQRARIESLSILEDSKTLLCQLPKPKDLGLLRDR